MLWFGIMCLILVFGDAFHLVPRVLAAVNRAGDYHVSMGIGTLMLPKTCMYIWAVVMGYKVVKAE